MLARTFAFAVLTLAVLAAEGACAPHNREVGWSAPRVMAHDGAAIDFDTLVERLSDARVVLIGEQHDAASHHLNQLEVICRLRAQGTPLGIAMEFFQQPFQAALERYVNEHGDIDRLLLESEYFTRWGFDFRLYAPILEYARRHRLPLVALNPPSDVVRTVARSGPHTLDPELRARVEDALASATSGYRARIQRSFLDHPGHEERDPEHFLAAQLLWDETMATRAARFLAERPRHRLVVLAGGGHVDFPDGVAERIERLTAARPRMLIQTRTTSDGRAHAFVLESTARSLPPAGRLGIMLDPSAGGIGIKGFAQDSAARDAGLEPGDRLARIDDTPITGLDRVRIAMWRKRPGDLVDLTFEREGQRRTMRLALR